MAHKAPALAFVTLLLVAIAGAEPASGKPAESGRPSDQKAAFPFDSGGETLYLKWGDNHAGTPGGTVTWSLVPAGVAGDAGYCDVACPGSSVATIMVETAPGAGFVSQSLADLEPYILIALQRWSAVTGIVFVKVSDSGLPINDPGAAPAASGHIRFAVFAFGGGGGAVGYAPPPNGGTGAGDVLLDANSFFQIAPGAEGEAFDQRFAPNDLPGLLLHELGHAVGLAHPAFDGTCPVMQVDTSCQGVINRILDTDDIDSARFLYEIMFADGFEG